MRLRKTPQQNRLVHSIDSAFDETNFTQIELPAENKTYEIEIEAKKKDQAAKIVTWKSKKPTPTGRLGRHNIISEKPGPTKYSKDAKTVLDSWKLFLSDDIISEIVLRTNEKIESFRQTVDPKIFEGDKCPYLKETNAAEIYAFIGLVYARGLQGQNSVRTELYSQKTTDIRFFLPQCRKTDLNFCFLRYLLMILKQEHSIGKRTDLQEFEIFLKNSIIIVENLSFRTIFFQLTKRYIP